MRALTGLAVAVAVLLAPGVAQAQDELIESLDVPGGTKPFIKTKTVFDPKQRYRISVSGSVTYTGKSSGDGSFSQDALYCHAATNGTQCPGSRDPVAYNPGLGTHTADTTFLDQFLGKYKQIPYNVGHFYGGEFTGRSGQIEFYDGQSSSTQLNYSGGFHIDIYRAAPDCTGTPTARAAAINEVRIVSCEGDCAVHREGADDEEWLTLHKGDVLKQGDEISCDPDGVARLAFADNSTVDVKHTTQLKIASFFTEGGVVRTEILLKMGEVAAKVCKSCATKSDFRIKEPTATASVRGTDFSVFYDPGSRSSVVSTREGLVEVDPTGAGLPTRMVGPGKEVFVTAKTISKTAKIGKAGARGGVNVAKAVALVMKIMSRGGASCGFSTPRGKAFSTKPAKNGWLVTARTTGKLAGTSKWQIARGKAKPSGSLAKRIAACR